MLNFPKTNPARPYGVNKDKNTKNNKKLLQEDS